MAAGRSVESDPSAGACVWLPAPDHSELIYEEVHVWRARLDQTAEARSRFWDTLSQGERRRSERFRRQRDRQHFIVARGILRDILARYLRENPGEIRFGYGLHGKPYLTGARRAGSLQFNLSHSDGMAVYAISTQSRVGIDIERVRPIPYAGLLREFSPAERSAISLLPEDEQREAFFRLWTCKEAYVKANGQGMSLPFGSFDLGLTVDQPTRMIRLQAPSSESTCWTFIDLPIDNPDRQEWTATVAAEGARIDLRCWSWCGRARVAS